MTKDVVLLDCDLIERITGKGGGCEDIPRSPREIVNPTKTEYYGTRFDDNLNCLALVEYKVLDIDNRPENNYELLQIKFYDSFFPLEDVEKSRIRKQIFDNVFTNYYTDKVNPHNRYARFWIFLENKKEMHNDKN